ncbi:hypothetical protein E4U40_008002, partial [Claviceps sp. LM458 group G5]
MEDAPFADDEEANTTVGSKRDASDAPGSAPSAKRGKRLRAKQNVQLGAHRPAVESSKGSTSKNGSSKPA